MLTNLFVPTPACVQNKTTQTTKLSGDALFYGSNTAKYVAVSKTTKRENQMRLTKLNISAPTDVQIKATHL